MADFFWYLAILLIPIGTREFFGALTPALPEYTGWFLYASDLAILLLIGYWLYKRRKKINPEASAGLFLKGFLACAALAVFLFPPAGLGVYALARLILAVSFACLIPFFVRNKKIFQTTLSLVGLLAVLEAGLGIYQFSAQHSVGLAWLGESPLAVATPGVAKLLVGGAPMVRAYGTFPHPNVLAAFLIFGLLNFCYLYLFHDAKLYRFNPAFSLKKNFQRFIKSPSFLIRQALAAGIFIIIFGLGLSFSRAGWIAASLALFFLIGFLMRQQPRACGRLAVLIIISSMFAYGILAPLVASRVSEPLVNSPALTERVLYNGIGLYLIKHYPLGVGVGNQVNFTWSNGLFQGLGLTNPWQWQPIHNLYILMASEVGVLGLLCFLIFSITLMWRSVRAGITLERAVVLAIFIALLAFGLFDHFLWDLQAGRLMLWLAIGLVLAATSFKETRKIS